MLEAIRAALPEGKLLTLNGLGPGSRYWAEPVEESPRVLLGHVDGAMSESIWRKAWEPLDRWPTPDDWMADVRMVQDIQQRGLLGFWWTKCWSDGNTSDNEPNAEVLVPQWRRFALASYLLAAGPGSYFNFDTRKLDNNAAEPFPEYDAPLGSASGPMQAIDNNGAYARPFSNGLVLVNPTSRAVTVERLPWGDAQSPPAEYVAWGEDRMVRLPLTVAAHTGMILTVAR
jgi:hypothetical protein